MVDEDGADAFSEFCDAGGLDLIVARIEIEVARSDAEIMGSMSATIPYTRAEMMRALFRLVHHALQVSGNPDRMRNLMDGRLPHLCVSIINRWKNYGAGLFSAVLSFVSSFLHAEPNSFQVVYEAGIPRAILAMALQDPPIHAEV